MSPRAKGISVNVDKLSSSLGRAAETIKVRYMGLGFVLAWIYCLWFSGSVLSEEARASFVTLHLSMGGSAVTLIALALTARRRKGLSDRWTVVAPLVMSATTVVLAFDDTGLPGYACALLGGLASAFFWLQWGELFCKLEQETLESNVSALALVTVAVAAVVSNLPHWFACTVVSLMPLVSGALLLTARGSLSRDAFDPQPEAIPDPKAHPAPYALLVPMGLCSAVFSAASSLVLGSASAANSLLWGPGTISAVIGGGLVSVALFFATSAFANRIDFSFLYRWMVPVMTVSLALSSVSVPVVGAVGSILAGSIAFMTDCLFIIVLVTLCRQGICEPAVAFGLFRGCIQLGASTGTALALVWGSTGLPVLVLLQLAVCLCAFVPLVVVGLENKMQALRPCGLVAATSDDCDPVGSVCERYRLSAREGEVIALLARGRSVPHIRETLGISKNTIETHIKHVYAKMDIHSKQELIDLLEQEKE